MTEDIEIAWAAGFYSGEGSASLFGSKGRPRTAVRLHLGQDGRQLDDLRRFHAAVRGIGNIRRENRPNRDYYSWTCGSRAEVAIAQNLLFDHLGTYKREQWLRAEEEMRNNRARLK